MPATFSNFILCELSHLLEDELLERTGRGRRIKREARGEISRRLEYGKRVIQEYSRPGQIIMIECPEEHTFNTFQKEMQSLDAGQKALRKVWQALKMNYNIYNELARYAQQEGRQVISLEPSPFKPGGKMREICWGIRDYKKGEKEETGERINYLVHLRRDQSMMLRIQRMQPELVIASMYHVLYLGREMKPKKVFYHNRPSEELIKKFIEMDRKFSEYRKAEMHKRRLQERMARGKGTTGINYKHR